MPFHVKKGAAYPFRGDWYIQESTFSSADEAVARALTLTQQSYLELGTSWDQYGYEWSVFEDAADGEKKIWEGYKMIAVMRKKAQSKPNEVDGWMG